MRGAGPSFAITTSITFPAPASATVFQYGWNLNPSDAAHVISTFQTFVQTDLPQEFDAEFVLGKGNSEGTLSIGLTGGWYGPAASFNAVIAPFLGVVPAPSTTTLTVGTYINSVTYLGGKGTLNTTAPDNTDTFYVKSLMTPPMSDAALLAFMNYTAVPGFTSDLVSYCSLPWPLFIFPNSSFVYYYRIGLSESSCGEEIIRPLIMCLLMRPRSVTGTLLGLCSSMRLLQTSNLPIRQKGSPSLTVSLLSIVAKHCSTFISPLKGMVDSILNNSPRDWDYG
jgi:hypothetical protein